MTLTLGHYLTLGAALSRLVALRALSALGHPASVASAR